MFFVHPCAGRAKPDRSWGWTTPRRKRRRALVATGRDLEGECDLQWDPVYGRDAYLAEWAAGPTGPWTQFYVGTKSTCVASSLTPGGLYYFPVRALGTGGLSPWSDIAQKRAS